jgi:diguanylate cyclase (GGDEF)-like protein
MALLFYILAVLIAATMGGRLAGLVTTLASLIVGVLLVVRPQESLDLARELIRVTVFAVEGGAISVAIGNLQQSTVLLRKTALQLEAERERAERLALEDQMTGMGNRRAFRRDFERALAQARRERQLLTLVIADVDGLKRTNDEVGHERGDDLLMAVAAAIDSSSRASDSTYRIGGDEFALLMPGTGPEEYAPMVRRLSSALAEVGEAFDGAGASFGAAHKPTDGEDAEALLRCADQRMYAAKEARQAERPPLA